MQNFVNNWSMPVELAAGAETLALTLPAGSYRITLADAAGASATRWEVVGAVVAGGVATLQRGLEGTADQAWPEGSVAYVTITAGFLEGLQQEIAAISSASYSIIDVLVPDGGLALALAPGVGHVNGYLDTAEPQPLRLVTAPLPNVVGVAAGRLRVNMEGITALSVAVPATPGITYSQASAQYDNAALDVSLFDGTFTVQPVGHVATDPWCVLFEFSIADVSGTGDYAVVAYIYAAAPNGPGSTSSGWFPPAPI